MIFAKLHDAGAAKPAKEGRSALSKKTVGGIAAAGLVLGGVLWWLNHPAAEVEVKAPVTAPPPLHELELRASDLGCPRGLAPSASVAEAARKDEAVEGWLVGADGYAKAMSPGAGKSGVLVYFSVPWCNYGKAADAQLFKDPAVVKRFKSLTLVRIEPEAGAPETTLADQFGVTVYPSLYAVRADGSPNRIKIFRDVDDKIVVLRPPEFLGAVEAALQ